MTKKLVAILLVVCIMVSILPSELLAANADDAATEPVRSSFSDVKSNDWFYEHVMYAVENGLFTGISNTKFDPKGTMTRAMYVTVMGHIAEIDSHKYKGKQLFSDVGANSWYAPYVIWAKEMGITSGVGDQKFDPNGLVTREQMAVLTVKFFDVYGIPLPEKTTFTKPKDLETVASYAKEAVLKLWYCGLFKGDKRGNFNPKSNATRAEAAAFCRGIDEKVEQWLIDTVKKQKPEIEDIAKSDPKKQETEKHDPDKQEANPSTGYTYYTITFDSNGGSDTSSISRREGANYSELPVPYKEKNIFDGWYYDAALTKRVGSNDVLRENVKLYAKWSGAAPLSEKETPHFASATDQTKDFTVRILGLESMTAEEVQAAISVKNFNSQDKKEWIKVTKNGSTFIVSGINYLGKDGTAQEGFEEGSSYKLTLNNDALTFEGYSQEVREFNFTIKKEDVFNLTLNNKLDFIKFEDISNIIENGKRTDTIKTTLLSVDENGTTAADMVKGTFTYTKGKLEVGDTVTIYEGIHPNERVLDDTREGANGAIAYVEITSVNGNTYGYKTANVEKVLFTPDVLPVPTGADTDGDASNNSITVPKSVMDFSDDIYSAVGLDSQTTVDRGDYISFYTGELTANPNSRNAPHQAGSGYALITEVTQSGDTYIITYKSVSLDEMLAAMDMYNTDPIDGNEMLKGVDVAKLEGDIEKQAMESGFAEEAGQYLASMAIETKAFTEITEDFELRNYEILNQNGEPLTSNDVRLMESKKMKVKAEVEKPEASITTKLEHFDTSGLRLTLKIKAKITIGPEKPEDGDGQIIINLTGEFEEEIHIGINVDGGARWEWWAIFPYIAEYEVTANIDLFNYTGLKFNASIVTKEYSDDKWTEDEELKNVVDELKKLVDEVKEGLGSDKEEDDPANDLIKKYKAMLDTESDWVNIVEKEIWSYGYRIPPIMIIEIKVEIKFVIQANMNISLGAEFWYKTAKRYSYNVEIFAQNVTSDVIDFVEEQYEFTFYVMGTLGLRAGIKAEAKICLFSDKFASAGFAAEAGAYIRMWGYFYYQLTYRESVGKESKYAGALYFELGIYLEITFEAQAFAGTFSYNPTLYENEWPLWSAGMRENIQDFAYKQEDAPELSLKKAMKTTVVPEGVFEMLYLDLKTGDDDTKIYDDSEKYFKIEMTNDKFSYDRATNRLTVIPAEKDITLDGQMVITWVNQPLAWTSKPISSKIDLHWDNLNDGYAFVFHTGGGSSIPILIKKYGEAISVPDTPVKKGYVFGGWYSDQTLTTPYTLPKTMPNFDMELYAKWIPADDTPYKVEYYGEILGNGQYELLEADVLRGTTDSTVNAVAKSFEGYITPESKQITIAPDGSSIHRYYYDRKSYTLTFSRGDAGGDSIVSTLKYGAKIIPPAFVSKGYAFIGWDTIVDANMPAHNISYTAQWTPSDDTPYRVEYYVEQVNGKYTLQSLDEAKTGRTGSTVDVQTIFDNTYLVENGITFKNVTVNGQETTAPVITADGKLIIKVNYQRESHNAIFVHENGQENTVYSIKYQGYITPPASNPIKTGYVFDGWEGYTNGDKMGTTDLTYAAKWKPAKNTAYTVKHIREDLNGSYPVSGALVEVETKYGTTDSDTTAEAKTYEGFTADTVTQVKILPNGSSEVTIKYRRNSYPVEWIADGKTYKNELVKYGAIITAPSQLPTKQGYIFADWSGYTEGAIMGIAQQTFTANWKSATDTDYTVKHIREDLSGNYTLEEVENKKGTTEEQTTASAKTYEGFTANTNYSQVNIAADGSSEVTIYYNRNSYTITWVANGETYNTSLSVKFEQPVVLPEGVPTNKEGYTFNGWSNVPVTMPAQSRSYEATWTANTYTVSFNVNGGEELTENTKEVTYDSTYGQLPTPTRAGYRFVTWVNDSNNTVNAATTVKTASDHTLRATWAAETDIAYHVKHYKQDTMGENYTVADDIVLYGETGTDTSAAANVYEGFTVKAFDQIKISGDGSTVLEIYYDRKVHNVIWNINGTETNDSYRYGASIIPPDAQRPGYSFAGWNGSIPGSMPDNNLSYTAQWIANKYTLSFNGNGGSSPAATTVTYDGKYGTLPSSTRTGYTFAGWFTEANAGTQITTETDVRITAAQTIYAQWSANTYTISFDLNTGEGAAPAAITVVYDSSYGQLPENIPVKTGYNFKGWYTAANGGVKIENTSKVTRASGHTLYAQWDANSYSVIFDGNGSDGGSMGTQSHIYDQSIALCANGFVKTGHTFTGWNTKADGSGTAYANTESVKNLVASGEFTLYAQWLVNSYTITFDSKGGSAVTSIVQDYGTTITKPEDPEKSGYTFGGWQRNGTEYTLSTMPAENLTLTAIWNIVDYSIIYELNGGTNSEENPAAYSIESGNITLREASSKTGYTFDNWYTDSNFTQDSMITGIAIPQGSTGPRTFYARWTANPYTVIFHKNIGDGETQSQSFTYDEGMKSLADNTFTRNGYTFDGWNTSENGTGTSYTDKQSVKNLTTSGTVNLYAKWKLVEYSITYNLNGGTQASGQATSFNVESQDIALKDPSKGDGYGFMGWYDNPGFTGNKVTVIAKGSIANSTLYAKWGFAGNFQVSNNGNNTFTITRSGNGSGDVQNVGQQTVYFRTINGTAIGGTHFYHQGGSAAAVTFADGETSKTVTITEYGVVKAYTAPDNSQTYETTKYSNIDRTYQLELVRVVGGGLLGATTKATRTIAKDNAYCINSSVYGYKTFANNTANTQIYESVSSWDGSEYIGLSGDPLTGRGDTVNVQTYLTYTVDGMKVKLEIIGQDDGWRMIRFVFFNNHTNGTDTGKNNSSLGTLPSGTKAAFVYGISTDSNNQDAYTVGLPAPNGTISSHPGTSYGVTLSSSSYADGQSSSNGYVFFGLNETCGISVAGYNSATADSSWWYKGGTLMSAPSDTREPQKIGIAPMAAGDYKAGETVAIAIVFDEIVDNANGVTINGTNLDGSWSCSGGAGSNVLYFTGTVKTDCNQDSILNGITLGGTPKDMAN